MRPFSVALPRILRLPNGIMFMLTVSLSCVAAITGGCRSARTDRPAESRERSKLAIDPEHVQAATTSFADRYITAMAEVYDRAKLQAKTPQARIMAQRLKILAGNGAIGNAVDPNPIVGLMDMALMVTLVRTVAQDKWASEMFGRESADAIVEMLRRHEADIWRVAATYLNAEQIAELHQLSARWRAEHPSQRYVASASLANFPESKPENEGAAEQIAGSVFGLVSLDPFHGLDPAVKEVAEARVLAERSLFYLRHAPIFISWQAEALIDQLLVEPSMAKLFADTSTVAGSTTRFSEATDRFSDASTSLAQTVEKFRVQLPDQQSKLVADLDSMVARQREGALRQATTQVAAQRDQAIQQLSTTITAQQDLLNQNVQTLTDQSIDRLYQRSRSLVLMTVGSIFLAFIVYRLAVGRVSHSKS